MSNVYSSTSDKISEAVGIKRPSSLLLADDDASTTAIGESSLAETSYSPEFGLQEFHQHFTSSFCADILAPKNYKVKLYVTREKLFKMLSCEKDARKILMELTPCRQNAVIALSKL